MIPVLASFVFFIATLFFKELSFISLVFFFTFVVILCREYWRMRASNSFNNSYASLIYIVSAAPFLYMIFTLFFEIFAPDLYAEFTLFMSGLSSVIGYIVPGMGKTIDGLNELGAITRAVDVSHKYSVVCMLGFIGASLCIVHGASVSKRELNWVDSQPVEAFSPDLKYMMYFGCFAMVVCVFVLSSIDASEICARGKCWTARYSDFPVFYLLPQLIILVGLFVGATIRRAVNWKYKQGEVDV